MAKAALNKAERTRQAEEFLSVAVWKSISFNSTSAKAGDLGCAHRTINLSQCFFWV